MTLIELARKLRALIEKAAQSLDETDALEATELYPAWVSGVELTAGMRVRDEGVLYSVLQTHTSQEGWEPENAPSLFAKVLIPTNEDGEQTEIPEWEQPDSTNPYMTGDKVMFNGQVYESVIDNNVWSPEAYPAGWRLVE